MGLRAGAIENHYLYLGATDREARAGTEVVHAINQLLPGLRPPGVNESGTTSTA